MIMEKRVINTLSAIFVVAMLMVSFTAPDAASAPSKSIASGLIWVVDKTISLSSLAIADGAFIIAPEGYSVTMTVDGVETGIIPGTYKGNIVLTVTKF